MNTIVFKQLTEALDAAMARVAAERFAELVRNDGPRRAAEEVIEAYDQIKVLSGLNAPLINDYFSLFYMLWFQPQNSKAAYMAALKAPEDINPLRTSSNGLYVHDFGCGTMTTLFGTAFAAADSPEWNSDSQELSVYSEDESRPMEILGWRLWNAFCQEISRETSYPSLGELRKVCDALTFSRQTQGGGTVWLTAHNIAYANHVQPIKTELDGRVSALSPDAVIVSARQYKATYMYEPPSGSLSGKTELKGIGQILPGNFPKVGAFRQAVVDFLRSHAQDKLWTNDLSINYLRGSVSWNGGTTNDDTRPLCLCYSIKQRGPEDDLPF